MSLQITACYVEPAVLRPGTVAKAICKVEGDEAVESVQLWLPDGGDTVVLKDVGGGQFKAQETVPFDAPSGWWDLTLVARGTSGFRAQRSISVQVG